MPRQQRRAAPARSAPARPVAAPARPAAPTQSRSASTMAHPPATTSQAKPPATTAQQQGPGLFGQMASTAAGVAVGSSIGHAIGGFFGGGSSGAPAEPAQDNTTPATTGSQDNAYSSNAWGAGNCDADAKQFTQCLSEHQGNMQICGWYLEQLKSCQAAARQY